MDYRIIIETEVSGKKWYYVQYRYLFFWRFYREIRDMSFFNYRVGWNTLEEAEQKIQYMIDCKYERSQQKIIKREVHQ